MADQPRAERDFGLDSLRGFAMFLGIVLHAAMSLITRQDFWPIRDSQPTELANVFLLAVHDFRMQLFFLLGGYFGAMLLRRYGLIGFLRNRFFRVAVPLSLCLVTIIPATILLFLYAEVANVQGPTLRGQPSAFTRYAAELVERGPEATPLEILVNLVADGEWSILFNLVHLWFLYYLMIFYVAVALLGFILRPGSLLERIESRVVQRLAMSRWRIPILAFFTAPLMLPMEWLVDTQTGWWPKSHILGYYFFFFGFGWLLFRQREAVPAFGDGWRWLLPLGLIVLLPSLMVCVLGGSEAQKQGEPIWGWKIANAFVSTLYTWTMICGLWGLFRKRFNRERAWVRYFSDASYWCYVASLIPLGLMQILVQEWSIDGTVKLLIIVAVSLPVLLASYEWGVRYTFIGAILNGRKVRG